MIIFATVWFLLGFAGSLFWPIYYRKNMEVEDWGIVVKLLPIQIFFGPFAFITSYPI